MILSDFQRGKLPYFVNPPNAKEEDDQSKGPLKSSVEED